MAFCSNCGSQLIDGKSFCGSCGKPVSETSQPVERPTRAWFLVPFFFNILGGVVGYFAVKNDDKRMANELLTFGVIMFVVVIIASAVFWLAIIASFTSP
jgi:uncharacterized membrane protein YvbJ